MPTNTRMKAVREPAYILKDLDKAAETALFYGFQPVKTPKIEKTDFDQASVFATNAAAKTIFPRPEEKISLLRTLTEWNMQNGSDPVMLHYKRPVSQLSIKRSADELQYSLDILGSSESVAEAIAIRTACAILADHGHDKLIVDINSIGDKHSINQFEKELINFTRKHSADTLVDTRQQLKKDPFEVWRCNHEQWLETRKRAPQSLNHLSEQSGEHFRGVLEYLETLEIPYRINPSLIGHRHYCSHTVFEIKNAPAATTEESGASESTESPEQNKNPFENQSDEVFAVGTRHNYLAKRIGHKHDLPLMSVNLRFKKPSVIQKLFFKTKPQPKFFFIQFGSIAKLKSLGIIESLRQARIPVYHRLTSDKFVGQLTTAETLHIPFVIIMGQKEALENTVVVRHMSTRSQENVPIPQLALYLSKLA